MALSSRTVTVGTVATLLSSTESDWFSGSSLGVKNPADGDTVFIGGPGVTAAGATQGWPLAAGESLFLDVDTPHLDSAAGEDVYAIVAVGTQSVNVLARGI